MTFLSGFVVLLLPLNHYCCCFSAVFYYCESLQITVSSIFYRRRVKTWSLVNEGKFSAVTKNITYENRRPSKKTRVVYKTVSSDTESRLEGIRITFLNIKQDVRLKFTNVLFTALFQRIKGNQSGQMLEI